LRNETSQSKENDKESHEEEIVIRRVSLPFEGHIFFLTREGNFVIGFCYIIPLESLLLQIKGLGFDEERR
jgi:hypothetical protein